ncbi:MAG: hypothetical protein KC431_02035 [Myxococcales bacterium]|nr:hypothetical protein [Myxococcales bacterium]
MPGPLHQGLVFLLNRHPRLAFCLAARFDPAFANLGKSASIVTASNELPDPAHAGNILHADGVVAAVVDRRRRRKTRLHRRRKTLRRRRKSYRASLAIEAQTCTDMFKLFSWLSHAAGVRRRFSCRGWTMVFCPDPDVRRFYQRIFAKEPRAAPWFVEPEMLPVILTVEDAMKDWAMAVLSSVFHATYSHAVASVRATLEAIHRLAPDDAQVYIDLMLSPLTTEQIQALPQDLLQFDPKWRMGPLEKRSGFYVRGREDGREEGREEGLQQGLLQAKRTAIQEVLSHRALRLSFEQQSMLDTCTEPSLLDQWFSRALRAAQTDEVFADHG